MSFINEYLPELEEETSAFFREARVTLQVGSTAQQWTVDREANMVLCLHGVGTTRESEGHEYWSFLDEKGHYSWTGRILSKQEISPTEIAVTRSVVFQSGDRVRRPDAQTRAYIRAVLQEYKDGGVRSKYKNAQLVLVDAVTGKEI